MRDPRLTHASLRRAGLRVPRWATGLGGLLLGLFCSGFAAAVMTVLGASVVPELLQPWADAGMPAPALTQAFAHGYAVAWLGPPAVLLLWRLGGSAGPLLAGLAGMAALALGAIFTVFALYLPIFQAASAI
ncbi:hypothetical protein [Stenotrophomonas rhizophila]|uniref:hypothetical protein n=1 Tax=Stenotrophomonas rhizophila TaxID=216778 RepID=UPI001E4A6959|nr:hypothetical protein [Stenotrophomonas rhizophila]MCC7635540.1 hypothetical protein [Stenotrophomonas rhizophila]MCC7664694.1 hypothetical protein [Stenotrophomonas rhizophila]